MPRIPWFLCSHSDYLSKWERVRKQVGTWFQSSIPYPLNSLALQFLKVELKNIFFLHPSFPSILSSQQERKRAFSPKVSLSYLAPLHALPLSQASL